MANIDLGHEARKRHVSGAADFLQALPEGVFEADAGLVPLITIERLIIGDLIACLLSWAIRRKVKCVLPSGAPA